MNNLEVINIFYRQNRDIPEYMDVFFETSIGLLKNNIVSINFTDPINLKETNRAEWLDRLKEICGKLYIREVRVAYDNNMYLLISDKFILAIEYILNSTFEHSVQEFRIIEDIYGVNKTEFDDYKKLDIVELPSLSM